ncbi:uncharacterized protein LOC107359243 [Tetranychus urticae]|uniref:DALR anticodon binding domain-containing protein n=1 Tax=Tetranychus urticae TaxID=32264 RepID=T1JYN5_TETUR|nr:uncharacterized protein LOC107359243 [Tetranychus urticae]
MSIIKLKNDLISNLLLATSTLGLPGNPQLTDYIGSSIVSDGFKGKNDVTLNLSNPVFSCWHNDLEPIGSHIVEQSKSWELPLSDFKVSGKSILFNINRDVAIPLLLREEFVIQNDSGYQSTILLNTEKNSFKELTRLRFKYIEETLVSLIEATGGKTSIRRANYLETTDQPTNDPLFDRKEPLAIDITQHKANIPFDLDETQFSIEPGSRLMNLMLLFNESIVPEDLKSDTCRIIILIHINDWKIGEKAITSWSILNSCISKLSQISFIPIADITSDLSLTEIKDHWRSVIKKQSETECMDQQGDCLIETCLRYIITSISPKVFHKLDLHKYKEALFIQYNYARLVGITNKFNQLATPLPLTDVNLNLLKSNHEWNLIYNFIAKYPVLLSEVLKPNPIAIHKIPYFINTFVNCISIYYNFTRVITEINEKSLPLANARIVMINKIRSVLHQVLSLIKIEPVQQM